MLAIVSDLHLTDGSSGATIKEGAFRVLRQRLSDLAYDASRRVDGKYRPIEEAHLVLLGDIFDLIRSSRWLDGETRPWSHSGAAPFIERFGEINDRILANNAASLAVLRQMSGEGLAISPATSSGEPDNDTRERHHVPLRIHYVVGNHDWMYHLPGDPYDAIRQSVVDAVGLYNAAAEPFPHDPLEETDTAQALLDVYRRHRVFARHGDIFDVFNYEEENGRDHSSLGDAIVVELLNRFADAVKADRVGNELPEATVRGLREIDNVRPLLLIPSWIHGLLRRSVKDRATAKRVKDIWDGLADDFLALEFVRERDKRWKLDVVDTLQAALKISKGLSLGVLSKLAFRYGERLRGATSYHRQARREDAYRSEWADAIVYGHTHRHEVVPLDAAPQLDAAPLSQIYVNSGTWRRVHELAVAEPSDLEFLHWNVMTYLAFFEGDERRGRPFESWSGSLGVGPEA